MPPGWQDRQNRPPAAPRPCMLDSTSKEPPGQVVRNNCLRRTPVNVPTHVSKERDCGHPQLKLIPI